MGLEMIDYKLRSERQTVAFLSHAELRFKITHVSIYVSVCNKTRKTKLLPPLAK